MASGFGKAFTAFTMAASVLAIGAPALAQNTAEAPAVGKMAKLLSFACGVSAEDAPIYSKIILSRSEGASDFEIPLSGFDDPRCENSTMTVSHYDGNDMEGARLLRESGGGYSIDRKGVIKGIMTPVNFEKAAQEAACVDKLSAQGIRPDPRDGGVAQIKACVASLGARPG